MNIYSWHSALTNDLCFDQNDQQPISNYFNSFPIDQHKLLPEYALEYAPVHFLEQLLEFPISINEQLFHFTQFVIREYGEIPLECPHGLIVYQLVVQAQQFPHGEWLHVFVNYNYQIVGLRIELSQNTQSLAEQPKSPTHRIRVEPLN
ncbi:hypothetical protein [Herpetosiphon giganteus]|uniref:hypothetical protein n=1 Tax=Herpetosiphon giganteus TaxID=2029754 RepID=UPI00195E2B4F|nr:hypothetical protein [Herpetosiphon giganteus]MBM7846176.1 hypothetical protein [Herpetosiphon giganteus]